MAQPLHEQEGVGIEGHRSRRLLQRAHPEGQRQGPRGNARRAGCVGKSKKPRRQRPKQIRTDAKMGSRHATRVQRSTG